ncbi:MAG TPA: hypothetical protein VJY15_14625 [Candidatus Acidoferrum sp.]|nr:hypothetical protein [Candidatus Acidoferrum sp.]
MTGISAAGSRNVRSLWRWRSVFEGTAAVEKSTRGVAPGLSQCGDIAVSSLEPGAEGRMHRGRVIRQFPGVNAPVVPLLGHHAGDHVAEHVRGVIGTLDVFDQASERENRFTLGQ